MSQSMERSRESPPNILIPLKPGTVIKADMFCMYTSILFCTDAELVLNLVKQQNAKHLSLVYCLFQIDFANVIHAPNCSWKQPELSNEGKMFYSRKQKKPFMGSKLTPYRHPISSDCAMLLTNNLIWLKKYGQSAQILDK